MVWIYISPHFDDVALSCGGLLWEQSRAGGAVQIWTVCAGAPPPGPLSFFAEELHERWGMGTEAARLRREEDRNACNLLGAKLRYYDLPDCIYRRGNSDDSPLYPNEDSIFGEVHREDRRQIERLSRWLMRNIPAEAEIVCPLTLGNHVDHQVTRAAVEKTGFSPLYYADYPYLVEEGDRLEALEEEELEAEVFPVSEAGLAAWLRTVEAYGSQISTFWADVEEMRAELSEYFSQEEGVRLWRLR